MVSEISLRIWEWLPDDVTGREEIAEAIRKSGWSQKWGAGTTNKVVRRVNKRVSVAPDVRDVVRERESPMGQAEEGKRTTMVHASDGTVVGKQENVNIWEDRWGNLMAHNRNTGTRKKLEDSDER